MGEGQFGTLLDRAQQVGERVFRPVVTHQRRTQQHPKLDEIRSQGHRMLEGCRGFREPTAKNQHLADIYACVQVVWVLLDQTAIRPFGVGKATCPVMSASGLEQCGDGHRGWTILLDPGDCFGQTVPVVDR